MADLISASAPDTFQVGLSWIGRDETVSFLNRGTSRGPGCQDIMQAQSNEGNVLAIKVISISIIIIRCNTGATINIYIYIYTYIYIYMQLQFPNSGGLSHNAKHEDPEPRNS